MLVVQLYMIGAEPGQRRLEAGADLLFELSAGGGNTGPELRGDHDLIANGSEGTTDQLLVSTSGVALGGVEEGAAQVESLTHQVNRLVVTNAGAVPMAEAHTAEADRRNLQPAGA